MPKQHKRKKIAGPVWIGLTGGIGAGKSTVARVLKRYFPVIDADKLAREAVRPGSPALRKIVKVFGRQSILKNGHLNRFFLRQNILENKQLRKRLEKILHPAIRNLANTKVAAHFKRGRKIIIYEAPLLFETKRDRDMDVMICVTAKDQTRIKRIMKRDKNSAIAAKKMLRAQMLQREKARRSEYVITNDGPASGLKMKIRKIAGEIKFRFGKAR